MRLFLLTAVAAGLWPGLAQRARAEDDPRAIIRRALAANGEPEDRTLFQGVRQKLKGISYTNDKTPFTGDFYSQNGRFKGIMRMEFNDGPIEATMVYNGSKAWIHSQLFSKDFDDAELADLKKRSGRDEIFGLVTLVKDKGYTLTPLGESKVEGRAAVGVQVKTAGQPTINLYFDKASGLLVKTQYRDHNPRQGKEVLEEHVLGDYREVDWAAAEEQVLEKAKLAVDPPALLAFFRQQTLTGNEADRIKELIRRLSDDTFAVREKATAELAAQGARAIPLLRQAAKDPDLEVSRRAQQCLTTIEAGAGTAVLTASAHLLAIRKPAGAAEVLLAYLPSAADESVARAVRDALAAVALRDGKPEPVLVQALEDKDPLRRAAATAALGRDGGTAQKQPGRRVFFPGLKVARKITTYQDGKKESEYELLEIQLFNKFDDGLFVQPR